jgi:tetratricopeptide (TPR) repeat protein
MRYGRSFHAKVSLYAVLALTFSLTVSGCSKGKGNAPYSRYDSQTGSKLAAADKLFFANKFVEAEKAYGKIVESNPKCVDAVIGLGRALRYEGKLDMASREFKKAYELDKSYPMAVLFYGEALIPWYGMAPKDVPQTELVDRGIGHLEEALKMDSSLAEAHLTLWPAYLSTGDLGKADAQLKALSDENYFPKPVLDFGYNLLASADKNAIIFTHGDMDTYPLLTLQQGRGLRTDVRVVNVNLLNLPWYAKYVRDKMGVPISVPNEVLDTLKPAVMNPGKKEEDVKLVSDLLIDDIIANAGKTPIYFAMVPPALIEKHSDNRSCEGLLTKVEHEPFKKEFNRDKAIENVEKNYHIDIPEKKTVWTANISPLTRDITGLLLNYGALYNSIASDFAKEGLKDESVKYFGKAADVFKKIGATEMLKSTLENWLRVEPSDPEALELKKSLT